MKKHQSALLYLLVIALIFNSCASPHKKKEDVGLLGRAYQNMTAYYNGYFNANELLDAAMLEIESKHPDNFQEQLIIYPYLLDQDSTTASGTLNAAIEKLKKDIYLHPASHWVDDSYFQMGKALFLKKDYERAENAFKYVVQNYSEAQLARDKANRMSPGKKKKAIEKERQEVKKEKEAEKEKVREEKADAKKAKEKEAKQKAADRKKAAKERKKAAQKKAKERKKAAAAKKKGKSTPKTAPKTTKAPESKPAGTTTPDSKPTDNKTEVKTEKADTQPVKSVKEDEDNVVATKKDKPSIRPKNYLFKHRPIFQQAQLWLAKTYIQRSNYEDGERILRSLLNEGGTYDLVRREALLVSAQVDMKKESYTQAIENLNKAIPMVKEKKRRARLTYILGQLYIKAGNYDMATQAFERVERLKPSYEMAFNASLSKFGCSVATGKISDEELNSRLNKMLKDLKNDEYQDQIYFMLADINLRNNDIAAGIKNLQKGIQVSKKGPEAKAESYLKLADIFYKRDQFDLAYHYYDSTATAYPKTKERFKEIVDRRDNLKDIAYNIETIQYQDSLLMVGRMTPEEQEALAKKLIKEAREKEKLATASNTGSTFNPKVGRGGSQPAAIGGGPAFGNPGQIGGAKPTAFFAYNDKTLKDGKRQFDKDWNNRPLADNWRYSALLQSFDNNTSTDKEEGLSALFISKSEIKKVLADVPTDAATIARSEAAIMDAMNALGVLYPDKIERYDKAIEVLEDLLQRFPDNPHEPQAFYQLYFAYMMKGNSQKANYYADLLKTKYNGNQYSLYFSDPQYIKNKADKEAELNDYYLSTYTSMEKGDYATAFNMAQKSDSIFGIKNILRPKFAMVTAMSLGYLKGKETYISALKDLVQAYPNTMEEKRAKEMLRLLGTGSNANEQQLAEAEKIYKATDADQHFILIIFKPEITGTEEVRAQVTDYNTRYFSSANLKIATITLKDGNQDRQVLLVRTLDNKIKAMEYYNQALNKKGDFISARFPYDMYAISNANYRELLRLRSAELYDIWFEKYYRN
ncbi:MAG: tetratricopeptide repeat protein [Saprospiraceae bacterium]|nr:tetratricopeptide repeat protein [Saprospiraceae bacterium]MBX7179282.1 tetratricopeptide repeat protein [Saprospiraceae bacterium]MCB0590934.1 tetratricopeptide repeat protein [Saprospiraceae bacterium]MCO5281906.1 tetratricopeptide repeat protein [Saprospiraceae bacterium]MCO6470534.1 tetratricopeptide repeat protein [Saprospiraceae bacterium]